MGIDAMPLYFCALIARDRSFSPAGSRLNVFQPLPSAPFCDLGYRLAFLLFDHSKWHFAIARRGISLCYRRINMAEETARAKWVARKSRRLRVSSQRPSIPF